jgi:hypothetical protein
VPRPLRWGTFFVRPQRNAKITLGDGLQHLDKTEEHIAHAKALISRNMMAIVKGYGRAFSEKSRNL